LIPLEETIESIWLQTNLNTRCVVNDIISRRFPLKILPVLIFRGRKNYLDKVFKIFVDVVI